MPVIKIQDENKEQMLELSRFSGVDFSSNLADVPVYRSPDSINMIADGGGKPVKRFGYEQLFPVLPGCINGIHCLKRDSGDVILVHHGTSLSIWAEGRGVTTMYSSAANVKSAALQAEGRLIILDGKAALCFDGSVVRTADALAYIPVTARGGTANRAGMAYESANLLTPWRSNLVQGDGSSTNFKVDAVNISANIAHLRGEVYNEQTRVWDIKGVTLVSAAEGIVRFAVAPPRSTDGIGNVRISYQNQAAGGIQKINQCSIGAAWDCGGETQFYVSGNKSYPNRDFQCLLKRNAQTGELESMPLYFPENGQAAFGTDASAIMGYLQLGENLGIIKETNNRDVTVYLRQASKTSTQNVAYVLEKGTGDSTNQSDRRVETGEVTVESTTKKGVAGVGAIARGCLHTLRDDPLFLSGDGVFAVTGGQTGAAQYAQPRSGLINKKLLAETGLMNAVATEFEGKLYLAVNGNVYVADGGRRHTDGTEGEKFQYEWYFWTGYPEETPEGYRKDIPVNVWFPHDGRLLFGTKDGKIMRFFNTETAESYYDAGQPIYARWTTPELDLDTYSQYKNINRICTKMQPYPRSSVRISMKIDGVWEEVDKKTLDVFSFGDIDFARFSFNMNSDFDVIVTKVKKRRVKAVQLRFENGEQGEGMGIYGTTVYYTKTGKVK